MTNVEPKISQSSVSQSDLTVRIVGLEDLDEEIIESWKRLDLRALEPNAFLTPAFVIPAMRYLCGDRKPVVLLVERGAHIRPQLVGLGVFELPKRTTMLPFKHWVAYSSPHTFLSGLLIDMECPRPVIARMLEFLTTPEHQAYGVEFRRRSADTPQSRLLDAIASEYSLKWVGQEYARATIRIPESTTTPIRWPKSLRENRNKLKRLGNTEYTLRRFGPAHETSTATFLALEHMGWKAELDCSLASSLANHDFFMNMVAGFAGDNRLLYSELTLNGEIIASTCNLISGRVCFGFKLGWNQHFARCSPGMLQHLELLENIGRQFDDLDYFDSCTSANSPVERVWPDRRQIKSGVFTYAGLSSIAAVSMQRIRQWRTKTGAVAAFSGEEEQRSRRRS